LDGSTKGVEIVRKVVAAGIAVVAVIAVVVISFVVQRTTSPVFRLIDHNWDVDFDYDENLNPVYTVTIFVKVRNDGIDGSQTIWCQITREDLSTIKKSKSLFLKSGQDMTINFVFSHSELTGAIPKEYTAWVD